MGEESLPMKKEVEGVSEEGLRTEEEGTGVLPEVQDGDDGQEEEQIEKELKDMSLGDSSKETENGTMEQGGEKKEEEEDDVRNEQDGNGVDQALKDALARHRHRSTVLLFEQEIEKFVRSDLNEYVFEREMTTYEVCREKQIAQVAYWLYCYVFYTIQCSMILWKKSRI